MNETTESRIAALESAVANLATELSRLSTPPSAAQSLEQIASRFGIQKQSVSRAIARYNAEHFGPGLKPVSAGRYAIADVLRLERWRKDRKRPGIGEQAWTS